MFTTSEINMFHVNRHEHCMSGQDDCIMRYYELMICRTNITGKQADISRIEQ